MEQMIIKGLEGITVAATNISLVDGDHGRLVYRAYWAKDLALQHDFEEVCYLLWHGRLPNEIELKKLKNDFREQRRLPAHLVELLKILPENMPMMSVIRTCISAMGDGSYQWPPKVEEAIKITAVLPTIIAARSHLLKGENVIDPHETLDHVANFLYMLNGEIPLGAHSKVLNAYFVLTMEHGMNASTFSSRVIASTESDIVSAITGAIGAMKGPLHGGAPSEVTAMLDEIGSKENAEGWIREQLEKGKKLMGFGHRIYKTRDPRAEALKEMTSQLTKEDPWLDLAVHVEAEAIRLLEEYKPGRKLYTNVEFYAAAVLRAVNMPAELFTPTFTSSRVAGWTANVMEQSLDNRIYRPSSLYNGGMPKD
ncbi:citrate synthase/methylcitrate synthase [Jeotgalibacillus soli]|uniref:Citrate synthase n=1 Tax=Jeotgalibacillus soli TaxID=889306 RepID=A0A0C2RNQ8_9BACL|nr:citrate synthase/methylcitrate synthase [Jeotgalibacillus soli]KIL51910.1 citrate synthase [Jeotgalibacillus soli]